MFYFMKSKFTIDFLPEKYFIKRLFLSLVLFLYAGITLTAQEMKVEGVVTDNYGESLRGVSVMLKGTQVGSNTDAEGKFSLIIPDSTGTLVFSYIGFQSQELYINGQQHVSVTLATTETSLEEIVVVAYGTQKKETLTGSVASVSSTEINTTTNSNLQNKIAGKIPGVRVQQRTGEPGNFDNNFDVRGLGAPLVVIDGVISDLGTFNRLSGEEIESISVLKDASASVYGLRAGNGVVLVTTKKGGTDGKAAINYAAVYGGNRNSGLPDRLDAYQWAVFQNESDRYAFPSRNARYTPDQLEQFRITPNTDWYDEVIQDFAPQTNHTISASGNAGADKQMQYYLSANYFNEEGAWKSGSLNYNRWNLRSNTSARISKSLTAEMNVGYIIDTKNSPYKDSWEQFKAIWTPRPIYLAYANGNPRYPQNIQEGFNPAVLTDSNNGGGYKTRNERRLIGQAALNWDVPFIEGLSARFMYNITFNSTFNKDWGESYQLYDYDPNTDQYHPTTYNTPTRLYQGYVENRRNGYQASLAYDKVINDDHSFKVLGLFEQIETSSRGVNASRQFTLDAVDDLFAGNNDATQQGNAPTPGQDAYQAFVGRLNYAYKSVYLLEAGFRYDGSSKFASENRFGFFPYTSVGWRLSEERFIKNTSALSFISDLKLRGSYGIQGDDGSTAYQWASGFTYPSGYYIFGNDVVNGISDRGIVNRNLTWFTTKQANIGLDWVLWRGKFSGSVDVFQRDRTGLLATRTGSLPGVVGANFPQENLNSDRTLGWELLLSHNHRIGEFNYSITGNISATRTKNIYQERSKAVNSFDNWRNNNNNRWNDLWWGMQYEGQFRTEEQIRNALNEEGTRQNAWSGLGDMYHADLNGDGWVDGNDVKPLWTGGIPKINYGATFSLSYKYLDVSLHFQGSTQSYVQYQELLKEPTAFGGGGALAFFWDRWHQDESGQWIAGTYPRVRDSNSYGPNSATNSFWVNDATFIRLKNAEVGYSLPIHWVSKAGMQKARIYVNGFNLLTLTGLKFTDPEHTSDTYGYLYPIVKNYNIGVNVIF